MAKCIGESQGRGSLVGCCLWGRTESDTTRDLAAAAACGNDEGAGIVFLLSPNIIKMLS